LAAGEIVDISRSNVKRRRQLAAHVGVPLLGVVLVILSILGISLYSYQANRAGALALSRGLLNGLQSRIAREVSAYLDPATQAALIARDMVARNAIPDGTATIEGFAASMLTQVPHLESFFLANGRGDFILVRRDPAGGTDTKLIINNPGARQVSSVHLNDKGEVLDRKLDPGDDFDPRKRVWYQGVMKTDGVYWSQPYMFYNTHIPGITAAIRLTQSGKPDRVFGVDITLEALSGFLASLHIGQTGRAAIVDKAGNVIAAPELAPIAAGKNAQAVHATVTTLSDPALAGAFDRYRIDGHGGRVITVGGRRFVTIASLLPVASQDWVLLIAAPESDFVAFAANNGRQHLLLSLVTIGLSALLGIQWLRQNRRADRTARLLSLQREIAAREARALSALTSRRGLFDHRQPAPALTESLAEMSEARRASIWRLAGGGRILHCEDSFDPQQNGHIEGLELSRSELPRLFDALDAGEAIELADAGADARTAELHRLVMRPFGSRAVSMLPIRGSSGVIGTVLLEDPKEPARVRNLARAVASIAAMRMAGQTEAADHAAGQPDMAQSPAPAPAADGPEAFSSMLAPGGNDLSNLAATVFQSVAAMIIRFDDVITMGRPDQSGVTTVADGIARAMQGIATRYALPYMKLTGHHLVAAAGCTAQPDPGAAVRLADAALAAREACLSLLAQSDLEPVFRIGMDYGPALGDMLGEEPRLFNLWGDVVRTAELMAQSVTDSGTIQVSESAYAQLRQQFLFRSRGVFYVPRIGTARTFILAGRR
jgi:adenylate cyclase